MFNDEVCPYCPSVCHPAHLRFHQARNLRTDTDLEILKLSGTDEFRDRPRIT
jgi:hypothetical protein